MCLVKLPPKKRAFQKQLGVIFQNNSFLSKFKNCSWGLWVVRTEVAAGESKYLLAVFFSWPMKFM